MVQAIFRFSDDERSLEAVLVVEYMDMKGNTMEKEFAFRSGEELQGYMKDIFIGNWYELFEDDEFEIGISSCTIRGIMVTGKNNKGNFTVRITDGYAQGKIIIDDELLKDANAQKIKEILEIAER